MEACVQYKLLFLRRECEFELEVWIVVLWDELAFEWPGLDAHALRLEPLERDRPLARLFDMEGIKRILKYPEGSGLARNRLSHDHDAMAR